MANPLLRALAALPLSWNHAIGVALGRLVYRLDRQYAARLRENLAISGIAAGGRDYARLLDASVAEAGKAATELLIAWLRPPEEVRALTRECVGWEHVENALARGKGIIFVTPHLGGYDIAGRYLASKLPITIMFRPPKLSWVAKLMTEGRRDPNATLAPADRSGVRLLLKTLKGRGNALILPDQAPSQGEGVWVDFFGRPAYTMTLIGRLHEATGAEVLMFFGERLAKGRGFRVWIRPLAEPLAADAGVAARQINAAVEALIRQCPSQYLWSYNRYKIPAGAKPAAGA